MQINLWKNNRDGMNGLRRKKGALYDPFTEQEQQLTEQLEWHVARTLQKQT